ncbi:hypothetical protein BKA93DRAFT_753344 [Sparassis latifolia]
MVARRMDSSKRSYPPSKLPSCQTHCTDVRACQLPGFGTRHRDKLSDRTWEFNSSSPAAYDVGFSAAQFFRRPIRDRHWFLPASDSSVGSTRLRAFFDEIVAGLWHELYQQNAGNGSDSFATSAEKYALTLSSLAAFMAKDHLQPTASTQSPPLRISDLPSPATRHHCDSTVLCQSRSLCMMFQERAARWSGGLYTKWTNMNTSHTTKRAVGEPVVPKYTSVNADGGVLPFWRRLGGILMGGATMNRQTAVAFFFIRDDEDWRGHRREHGSTRRYQNVYQREPNYRPLAWKRLGGYPLLVDGRTIGRGRDCACS